MANDLDIAKDIIIPFFSVLLGTLLGGYISFKVSWKIEKGKHKCNLLNDAIKTLNQVEEAVFFLALDPCSKEKHDSLLENFKIMNKFFSNKVAQDVIGIDITCLVSKISDFLIRISTAAMAQIPFEDDFIKQCFEISHDLRETINAINGKQLEIFNKW